MKQEQEEALPAAMAKKKEHVLMRLLKLLLKIGVTAFCFWYISQKIDFTQAWDSLLQAKVPFLALTLLLYLASKLIGSYRLNIYFRNINLHLSERANLRLYWLGMFYNLFLPGAISGDAYKVILLNRRCKAPYKETSTAVLLDRFSGLLAIGLLFSVYGVLVLHNPLLDAVLVTGSLAAVLLLYAVIRKFFPLFLSGFLPTLLLGLVVQGVQVLCLYCLLFAVQESPKPEWIFIFLAAAVVSVLPLSLGGGLGTRELVFAEGALFFHLDQHLAVTISLLFYLCNLLTSVAGSYFVFVDPLKNVQVRVPKIEE